MQVKLLDVVVAEAALGRLFNCHPPKAKDTHRLAKIIREVKPIQEDYLVVRREMLEKHAVPDPEVKDRFMFVKVDDDGEIIRDENKETIRDNGAIERYEDEHKELVETEMVNVGQFVTLAYFDRCGLEPPISPLEMNDLWWLVKEMRDEFGKPADKDKEATDEDGEDEKD